MTRTLPLLLLLLLLLMMMMMMPLRRELAGQQDQISLCGSGAVAAVWRMAGWGAGAVPARC